jgi:CrcB protein
MAMSQWLTNRFGDHFPVGTLAVNVFGSFMIGLVASLLLPHGLSSTSLLTRQFLMVGVLGGFTTFSSFSLQTLFLLQSGAWARAGMNVLLSLGLCIAAVWIGYAIGTAVSPR